MNPISWYFDYFIPRYFQIATNFLIFVDYYFAIRKNSASLFAPWKNQTAEIIKPRPSWFDKVTFSFVSRLVGFGVRTMAITAGLMCLIVVAMIEVVTLGIMTLLPVLLIPFYQAHIKSQTMYRTANSLEELISELSSSSFFRFVSHRTGIDQAQLSQALSTSAAPAQETLSTARNNNRQKISHKSIFEALAETSKEFGHLLLQYQIKPEQLHQLSLWHDLLEKHQRQTGNFWEKEYLLSIPSIGRYWAYGFTTTLDQFCEDLSQTLSLNNIFVSRETEIDYLVQVLNKPAEPNVLVYGEVGVGRHALVKGLVQKANLQEISSLIDKRFLLFRTEKFLAQSNDRNAAQLLSDLIAEASRAGNVVLIIDNFDELVHRRSEEHDLSKAFEELLGNHKLPIIAITTREDYFQKLRHQDAIMKFFSSLELEEMDKEKTLEVLFAYVPRLEKTHGLYFSFQSLVHGVTLAQKYLLQEKFPEKAIDMMNELASFCVQNQIQRIEVKQVEDYLRMRTKIPIGTIQDQERDVLLDVENVLREEIIEQDPAVEAIGKSLRRSRMGVAANTKPMGTFLFLGPTGVGKTQTAKVLSKLYFQTEDFIRFDMAEFQTADSIDRLLGSHKHRTSGLLAEKIEARPYGLLLLDEFEKAPEVIRNLFLSVLDEGSFTSADGKRIDCRNLMIIATSNAASEEIRRFLESNQDGEGLDEHIHEYLLSQSLFTPELLNRFDAVVVYRPLSSVGLRRIADLMLQKMAHEVAADRHLNITFGEDTIDRVISQGYKPTFGARSLEHYINNTIADEIAKKLLENPDVQTMSV